MTHGAIFRIVLALHLVLWAPAWSCCVLQDGVRVILGQPGRPCCCNGGTSFEPAGEVAGVRDTGSCCGGGSEQTGVETRRSTPRRCMETDTQRLGLDLGGKIVVPGLDLVSLIPESQAPIGWDCIRCIPRRFSGVRERPPPDSLLARHCLLTI